MDPSPLTASPELQWSAVLSILLLSIAVPAAIFLGRNNVRSRRRDLVRDLVNLFGFAKDPGKPDHHPLPGAGEMEIRPSSQV